MKKFLSIITIIGILILSSCNKDEDKKEINLPSLIGNWKMTKLYSKNLKIKGNFGNGEQEIKFSISGKNYNSTFSFSKNPNKVNFNGNLTMITTMKGFEEQGDSENEIEFDNFTGEWSIEGNDILKIKGNKQLGNKIFIEELTDKVFIIRVNSTSIENEYPIKSDKIKFYGDVFYKFEKIK